MVELNSQVRSELESLLQKIPASKMQSAGLATFYLLAAPSDRANQCVPASAAIHGALSQYGTKSVIVPATLHVSWSAVVRGSSDPVTQPDGSTNGHFIVVTENDEFIDATALQFDDIADRRGVSGFMPLVGRLEGLWSSITSMDPNVRTVVPEPGFQIGRGDSYAIYKLHASEAGSQVVKDYIELNASNNLLGWQRSLADIFAWMLGNHILVGERSNEVSQIDDPAFSHAVKNWLGKPA
ncbi:hypothetical protein ACTXML_16210, partial [Glutamicibacter arilaitensis]